VSYCNFTSEGFTTKDADIRYTQAGKKITSFSIAVNYGKDDKKTVHFFDCMAWDYPDEIRKGTLLKLSGYIKTERWDGKDGQKHSKVVLVAKEIEVVPLTKKQPTDAEQKLQEAGLAEKGSAHFDDENIPFIYNEV
jgi:single-strand DNA-binding protein